MRMNVSFDAVPGDRVPAHPPWVRRVSLVQLANIRPPPTQDIRDAIR
jgi:hypothetical protein